jgi:nicotinamide phosphoribosyltransferase
MGGGLLQKVNRDTQRCAFKSSAQCRNGVWYDIFKNPADVTKASKKGKLKLIKINGEFVTVSANDPGDDYLKVVFENGELVKFVDFDTVRQNATLE